MPPPREPLIKMDPSKNEIGEEPQKKEELPQFQYPAIPSRELRTANMQIRIKAYQNSGKPGSRA